MNALIRTSHNDLNFLNDWFDGFFTNSGTCGLSSGMKTDIKESEKAFTLEIEVPGFGKDDIKISLENGYLTIEVQREESPENSEVHYLRKERFLGSSTRTFFVGDNLTQEDVKASFDSGILTLLIPKKGSAVKEKKFISIL